MAKPLADTTAAASANGVPLSLVWHARPQGQVDYVNAAWCAYTGLSLATSRGSGWQQALHPNDREHWLAAWAHREPLGETALVRCRIAQSAGGYGWFACHVEAIRDTAGDVTGWMGFATATDVALLQETSAAPLPLPESAGVGGTETFLAAAVHDLKNQLGVIRGTAQLLTRRLRRAAPAEPEQLLAGLAEIERSTEKMDKLIVEFFDLSRMRRGQPVEFNCQPTDIVALARACIARYAPTTDHVLAVTTTDETLVGSWDGERLERVLENLLSNAVKYSPSPSAVTVAIERTGSDSATAAVLTVADHGIGIPATDLPRVFTPFFRGSNVARRTTGTGIGLFGARAIVVQQGGRLTVESREGRGTTVTLWLPLDGGTAV